MIIITICSAFRVFAEFTIVNDFCTIRVSNRALTNSSSVTTTLKFETLGRLGHTFKKPNRTADIGFFFILGCKIRPLKVILIYFVRNT